MTDRIIQNISTWNFVRGNTEFDESLEYDMLVEELNEFRDSSTMENRAKELADIVFVALGSLYKYTGSAEKTKDIMDIVIRHNSNKGFDKDSNGKVKKVKQPSCEPQIKKVLSSKVYKTESLFV
jgi:predicted house-cleaning noncanonical NTP pyrophosphatase (MazG superfamily)